MCPSRAATILISHSESGYMRLSASTVSRSWARARSEFTYNSRIFPISSDHPNVNLSRKHRATRTKPNIDKYHGDVDWARLPYLVPTVSGQPNSGGCNRNPSGIRWPPSFLLASYHCLPSTSTATSLVDLLVTLSVISLIKMYHNAI